MQFGLGGDMGVSLNIDLDLGAFGHHGEIGGLVRELHPQLIRSDRGGDRKSVV
jgi:hypothetical protein